MIILDGKKVSLAILERLKGQHMTPTLLIVQIGDNPASNAYIAQKKKFGEAIGATVRLTQLPEETQTEEIEKVIRQANTDKGIHGIIIQLPLPNHLDPYTLFDSIDPQKDVDGLGAVNIKKLYTGNLSGHIPATAKGILTLLEHYDHSLDGKKVTIIGRSPLVGKPTAQLALLNNATVTICHSHTQNLHEHTRNADILIVATGIPNLITKEHVHHDQTIIDVGINLLSGEHLEEEIPGKKFVGDVAFDEVAPMVQAISPVPGGVGPMTVASLFENLYDSVS